MHIDHAFNDYARHSHSHHDKNKINNAATTESPYFTPPRNMGSIFYIYIGSDREQSPAERRRVCGAAGAAGSPPTASRILLKRPKQPTE